MPPGHQAISLPCADIIRGCYRYTRDLLELNAASAPLYVGHRWPGYQTPIQVEKLTPFLSSHPDTAFAAYIQDGLTNGFRIGFNPVLSELRSRVSNHPSVLANERVVDERIAAEVRLCGPLPEHLAGMVHVSPMETVSTAWLWAPAWMISIDVSSMHNYRHRSPSVFSHRVNYYRLWLPEYVMGYKANLINSDPCNGLSELQAKTWVVSYTCMCCSEVICSEQTIVMLCRTMFWHYCTFIMRCTLGWVYACFSVQVRLREFTYIPHAS